MILQLPPLDGSCPHAVQEIPLLLELRAPLPLWQSNKQGAQQMLLLLRELGLNVVVSIPASVRKYPGMLNSVASQLDF